MMDGPTAEFGDQLRAYQLILNGPPIVDGKIHRIDDATSRRKRNKNGWYVVREVAPGLLHGCYGSWGRGGKSTGESWSSKRQSRLTRRDRIAFREARAENKRKVELALQEAAKHAQEFVARTKPADPAHPYLIKKQIKPNGAQQHGGEVVHPANDLCKVP